MLDLLNKNSYPFPRIFFPKLVSDFERPPERIVLRACFVPRKTCFIPGEDEFLRVVFG